MRFRDRSDAGRRLGARLGHLSGENPVVLGLPRGGVAVAAEVAGMLSAPLDVILVRKLGVPAQPELGMGAIGEGGARVINSEIVTYAHVSSRDLALVEERERAELLRRARRYRGERPRLSLTGRTAVLVDDGIATGSTARAACQVAKAQGATRVVLAVPVAPMAAAGLLARETDEFISLAEPEQFQAIGEWYDDFSQTSDEVVVALLEKAGAGPTAEATESTPDAVSAQAAAPAPGPTPAPDAASAIVRTTDSGPIAVDAGLAGYAPSADAPPRAGSAAAAGQDRAGAGAAFLDEEVVVHAGATELPGHLTIPRAGAGIVVFAHGSGSSRHSPRNGYVAGVLAGAGLGSLMFDLLTPEEAADRANVFDIGLLAGRLADATRWLREQPAVGDAPIGYFGASTGAAAALRAAAEQPPAEQPPAEQPPAEQPPAQQPPAQQPPAQQAASELTGLEEASERAGHEQAGLEPAGLEPAARRSGGGVAAVVSRGGRPDLAAAALPEVRAPTLLIVGALDDQVLALNQRAREHLRGENTLAVVPGASHLFEEPGTLERVAELARDWFTRHLVPAPPAG